MEYDTNKVVNNNFKTNETEKSRLQIMVVDALNELGPYHSVKFKLLRHCTSSNIRVSNEEERKRSDVKNKYNG